MDKTQDVAQLLARVAELEDALRQRVTAEELPPEGVDVLGEWDGCRWPRGVTRWDGDLWWAEEDGEDYSVSAPDRWMPIPGVGDGS